MRMPHTVMFVDDDNEDVEIFCEAIGLIDNRIQRIICANGKEAINLLSNSDSVVPDFIFLDINMPVMNGMECFVALKKIDKLKHVPVIMCSTSKYIGDQLACEKLGADFYLVKPNTLIKVINAFQHIFSAYQTKKLKVHKEGKMVA